VTWAIGGTRHYGLGLARYLAGNGRQVAEIDSTRHVGRRRTGKSDPIAAVVQDMAPGLVEAEYGLGALTAAQLLLSWSHAGRIRSEAAFGMLSGTAPVPVSSGRTDRHRLNRLGDRQLNRALHTIMSAKRATSAGVRRPGLPAS